MSRTTAIERLTAGVRRIPEPQAPRLAFEAVDEAALARGLDLEGKGAERGARGEPPADAKAPDHVESEIRDRVESARRRSDDILADESRIHAERIAALDFEGRFAVIGQAAPAAVGEFASEAAQGRDELHALRRALRAAEGEMEAFRRRHGIERPPRVSGGGARALKLGLVAALLVAEIALNGTFLARGNELGLAGGAVEATAFAVLNVGVAFLVGLRAARLVAHRNWFLKASGAAATLAALVLAIALNLALAHYREVLGPDGIDAGRAVVSRLAQAPLALADLKSWLLFGVGLLFAAVAFADGVSLDDPYPGYGGAGARLAEAHDAYIDRKAALIERLGEIRDDAMDALNEAGRDLAVRRSEHDAILDASARLRRRHADHVDLLESSGRRLTDAYREANARARTAPAPAWFADPFRLARHDAGGAGAESHGARDDLRRAIAASQAILDRNVAAVHEAYDAAARSYREIDDILPEEADAHARQIAA